MANSSNPITSFEADFGDEAVAPAAAGGVQPPTGLYRVRAGKCFVKVKDKKQPQVEIPWSVSADPLKAGGLGKGGTDWQTIPNPAQDAKNKATTAKFLKKALVAFGSTAEKVGAIKGKRTLDYDKLLSGK